MSNPLHNICVCIEDEAHLKQARELLERFGEPIHTRCFIKTGSNLDYLKLGRDGWYLGMELFIEQQITLTELQKLLEDARKTDN